MISPAIHFGGNCYEAMTLYKEVFNGTDMEVSFYRDAPENPGFEITDDMSDLVMHASMTICGSPFNFCDVSEELVPGNMVCMNVFMASEEQVIEAYKGLTMNGEIVVELGPQFFSKMYASVIDPYGIKWQLIS